MQTRVSFSKNPLKMNYPQLPLGLNNPGFETIYYA